MPRKKLRDFAEENRLANVARTLLNYNPITGKFTWKKATTNRVKVGDPAGSICKTNGYVILGINGVTYKAHRVAWLMIHGEWPASLLDHRDENRANNVWTNLRLANHSQNLLNRGKQCNNTSGMKNVHWNKQNSKWKAKCTVRGVEHFIGFFQTREEANDARITFAKRHCGEFFHI